MRPEWEAFTVGRGPAGPGLDSWAPLVTVKHTTHLLPAIRIAEDHTLSAELIYDGVLRSTRTKVVYFSPKYWPNGSRYGAFEFTYDWAKLLDGRKMYWVEAIRTYETPIFRFMLTSRNVSHLPVAPYDPDSDDGPIRRVAGDWFWTRNDAAEIVIDEDVLLADAIKAEFGKHHDMLCSVRAYGECRERGYEGTRRAMQAFTGVLLGRGIHSLDDLLRDGGRIAADCRNALAALWLLMMGRTTFGGPITDPEVALDLVRATCLMVQTGDDERMRRMLGLVADQATVEAAILRLIRDHFNDPAFTWDE